MELTEIQRKIVRSPISGPIALRGPAGTGKTTAACERMLSLVNSGVSPQAILVLVPQRSLGFPYRELIHSANFPAGGEPSVLTLGGLAQRSLALFWPLVSSVSGFKKPSLPPTFLTLETAQYYLAQIVAPLLDKGYFETVTIDPNRIFSQILDNLNKSAVVGFELDEIANRLKSAWSGAAKQVVVYDQVQECATRFRQYCLENNFLDYSLQFELFVKYLWPSALYKAYLQNQYQYLIYENIEEDVPIAHDLIRTWLPDFQSSLLIEDKEGGYRTFLGADYRSADTLIAEIPNLIEFSDSFVQSPPIREFHNQLNSAIHDHKHLENADCISRNAFSIESFQYYPQAVDWLTDETTRLIKQEAVRPGQIVILTPYLSDSLRFTLTESLTRKNINYSTFRPSRSLQEEPSVKAMITLAKLINPQWKLIPSKQAVRYAFMQIIPEADLIRSDMMSQTLYTSNRNESFFGSFSQIRPEMQERITYTVGNKFETLKKWVDDATGENEELDILFSRLFGEILSQPGFSFHKNFEAASIISRLIESCRKFRQSLFIENSKIHHDIGKEYIQMLEQGVLSAQYLGNWDEQNQADNVLIAPASTYLMSNRPVAYQFWLDIGSNGWCSRLDQPLTQPYVLSRNWINGQKWTGRNELEVNQETLSRVTSGLLRRCSTHVDLITVGINESGNEERGFLLLAVQTVLRGLVGPVEGGGHV